MAFDYKIFLINKLFKIEINKIFFNFLFLFFIFFIITIINIIFNLIIINKKK